MWRRGRRWRSQVSGNQGRPPSELKTCEHDEDAKVEDGTPLRIVETFCDTMKSGPEIRLQMLEIGFVSHLVPVRVISSHWDEIISKSRPSQGYPRRVETFRRHLVDDASSATTWPSGKRGLLSFAHNQMQGACVARVDNQARAMLVEISIVGVPVSAEALPEVLRGLDAYDSGARSSTLSSLCFPKLPLPVDATGACVARLSEALSQGARAHDARCPGDVASP